MIVKNICVGNRKQTKAVVEVTPLFALCPAVLTLMKLRRIPIPTMSTGFDEAFRRVKQLVACFRGNEKFELFQDNQAKPHIFFRTCPF